MMSRLELRLFAGDIGMAGLGHVVSVRIPILISKNYINSRKVVIFHESIHSYPLTKSWYREPRNTPQFSWVNPSSKDRDSDRHSHCHGHVCQATSAKSPADNQIF